MAVDGTMLFTATTKDANQGAPRWTSSEPSVATIDDRGVATGCRNNADHSDGRRKD
jgi:uncharacterized protein YjdB